MLTGSSVHAQVVIFVKSVMRAKELNKLLVECNFPSICIHSAQKQEERYASLRIPSSNPNSPISDVVFVSTLSLLHRPSFEVLYVNQCPMSVH